ncbi:uncharacterized protein [Arachis hypogaea]|uniref:uncharacterized protein isoform X5 n=1 Tax=Arachis hypogaea TaxID=3818 RepID=UPI003B220F28
MADGTLQSYRHHCAAPLSNDVVRSFETAHWTVLPFIRDSFCMIGYAIGATTSAFYGFNNGLLIFSEDYAKCSIPSTEKDYKFHVSNASIYQKHFDFSLMQYCRTYVVAFSHWYNVGCFPRKIFMHFN